MAGARRFVRGLVAAWVASACGAAPDVPEPPALSLEAVSPAVADFRTESRATLTGKGFGPGTRVFFGELEVTVVSQGATALEVRLPALGRPAREAVEVRDGERVARWAGPFVWRGMAPEQLVFVDLGAVAAGPVDRLWAADLDADGKADLVLGAGDGARWLKGDGALGFAEAGAVEGRVLAVGSGLFLAAGEGLDHARRDGETWARATVAGLTRPELVSAGPGPPIAIGLNSEGKRALFLLTTGEAPTAREAYALGDFEAASLATGDADGDGAGDVLLGGMTDGPRLLLGDGQGQFREAPAGTFPERLAGAAALVDVNADQLVDVVISTAQGDRVLLRAGARFLDRTETTLGFGRATGTVAFTDLDADGALDRLAARPGVELHRNDGTGRFFDYTSRSAAAVRSLRPLGAADLDRDGDPDLLARDGAGRLHVLQNWAPRPFEDPDGDGIPSARDVCPDVADPEQLDRDAHPFSCADEADCLAQTGCRLVRPGNGRVWLACGARTFDAAVAFCSSRGARLALPRDADEAVALVAAYGGGWIDLSDRAVEGEFVDSAGMLPAYSGWNAGEPNDAGGNEDCTEMGAGGGWNDIPCDHSRAFACDDADTRVPDGLGDACDPCPLIPGPCEAAP